MDLLTRVKENYPPEQYAMFEKAYYYAKEAHKDQKRMSGEPYFIHPYSVAGLVLDLGIDIDTACAALLHDVVEDTDVTCEDISKEFSPAIADLVDGVTKLSRIGNVTKEQQQAESIRKMFLAMAKDIRVIFIKLSDRLHNMRTLEYGSREKQIAKATETIEIYAPLAHRLGMYAIKAELEDLCLRYLHPEDYYELKRVVEEQSEERKTALKETIEKLKEKINAANITCEISGRDKSLYSIYKKMEKQHSSFDQIFDLTAVRVLVKSIQDCYAVLGIVHDSWKPIPGKFKDYVAMPKPNMYQSLHTTLVSDYGMAFEVQIRTFAMHRTAEYGISAHWKYKEGGGESDDLDAKLSWLRSLMEWQNDLRDANEFMNTLKVDFFSDNVFVFSPKGDVRDLVRGATPLDFAYSIHSAIGNKCVGAKVNNRIVQLGYELKTGDIVEILTSNSSKGPSRDWLQMVKTLQAKNKIRQWFKKQLVVEHLTKGKELLEKEAKRHGYQISSLTKQDVIDVIVKKYKLSTFDVVCASVGSGAIPATQVITKMIEEITPKDKIDPKLEKIIDQPSVQSKQKTKPTKGVIVKGCDDMLVRFSHCCNPVPGDEIIGFITRGRGVSIHRLDCTNIMSSTIEKERIIPVAWASDINEEYIAQIQINAIDRRSIWVYITKTINDMDIEITAISGKKGKLNSTIIDVSVKIHSADQLTNLLKKLKSLKDVIEVFRTGN